MDNLKFGENGTAYNEITQEGKLSYDDYVSNAYSAIMIEDYDLAMNFTDQAILQKPKEPEAYGAKGVVYLQIGNKESAKKHFETAIHKYRKMMGVVATHRDENELRKIEDYDFHELVRNGEYPEKPTTFRVRIINAIVHQIEHYKKIITTKT